MAAAAYAGTAAPVAALFAIMTKVGAYAILRTATLLFGDTGTALANLFEPWLLPLALGTLGIGMLGALAAESLGRLAAWLVVASVGTLLTAFTLGAAGIAAGLYYLPHGTFATAALFLLADAITKTSPGDRGPPDAGPGPAAPRALGRPVLRRRDRGGRPAPAVGIPRQVPAAARRTRAAPGVVGDPARARWPA